MKIKNLADVKISINKSTLLIFAIIFVTSTVVLYLTHVSFIKKKTLFDRQQIRYAEDIYQSNLSEKLSIIASSTVFLDYLRSGYETRKSLYPDFLYQMKSLNVKSVSGVEIFDNKSKVIFYYGKKSHTRISLDLCYLNQTLDSEMGECNYTWVLFFDTQQLLKEISFINPSIKPCINCEQSNFFNKKFFGSFPINSSPKVNLKLDINEPHDFSFVFYLILFIFTLSGFAIWNWYHVNKILNNTISVPIKSLTYNLKHNNHLSLRKMDIEEFHYLANEIQSWKDQLRQIEKHKNTISLGKIVAQVAHDIRSPLAALSVLISQLINTPENLRNLMRNSTHRISEIANNLLRQYNTTVDSSDKLKNNHIANLLDEIICEKRAQYYDKNIEFKFNINESAKPAFSLLDGMNFKRVLSNLINNSVEAITTKGNISINLSTNSDFTRIEIIDNGCGIPSEMIPKILEGGFSAGKKNGSGLGVSHAITCVENWGGDMDINSRVNEGTQIGINLMSSKPPEWFASSIKFSCGSTIIILDDELISHQQWSDRFNLLDKGNQLNILHFYTVDDLIKAVHKEIFHAAYFIDFDLNSKINGLDLINTLDIQHFSYLVTNRYDDQEIQEKCIASKLKMIPKYFIPYISLEIE